MQIGWKILLGKPGRGIVEERYRNRTQLSSRLDRNGRRGTSREQGWTRWREVYTTSSGGRHIPPPEAASG
ncbi:MAG: hypothetical protein FJ249_01385 [Nitrospira sp.]|nr:hypothetical protein [Nitrospira sp.]